MSIWEQVAVVLAKGKGNHAERQYKLLGEIDSDTERLTNQIHYRLRKGEAKVDPDSIVDLFVKIKDEENYFDITSAKPNMKEFVALKLKLLRWTALRLSQEKNAKVFTRLSIPYNPYHPEPYERWTLKGLYD